MVAPVLVTGVLPMTPVAAYERRAPAARGLPMTMSPAQVEAQLAARRVSVPALTAALAPVLSPAETVRLAPTPGQLVTLHYSSYGNGLMAAETRTGTIVQLQHVVDGIAVAPDASGLRAVMSVLQVHRSVHGVPAAIAARQELANAPAQRVYELCYTQTPASVAAVVATARSQLDQVILVEEVVPIVAGALGLLVIVLGLLLLRQRPPADRTLPDRTVPAGGAATGTAPVTESAPPRDEHARHEGDAA